MTTRIQLSLFVDASAARSLEAVRRTLDPVQSRLIPAHVTLCREDELALVETPVLRSRLVTMPTGPVTLEFGPPERFQGHGILLPCIAGEPRFIALREFLLGSRAIRRQAPHITLAHPRNPEAAGNRLENAAVLPARLSLTFSGVQVIEQVGTAPWRVLETYDLPAPRQDP